MTVKELAERLGGDASGNLALEVKALASLLEARVGDVAYLKDVKYARQVSETKATAVLVAEGWQGECAAPALIHVPNPDAASVQVAQMFSQPAPQRVPGIHPTAIIDPSVKLGERVHVGPWSVIEAGTTIGDDAIIEAQVFIGERVVLGAASHIYPQVTIREGCRLGKRVILHSGVRIGGDGYGYNTAVGEDGCISIDKIPQLGIVELGDDVEVGSNTTIDRARFGRTSIGNATKIDNLVQIGHNVQVGEASGVIAQAGVAGSTRIGSGCLIWAQAGISGHLTISDRAQVGPKSGLSKDVGPGEYVLGIPAISRREFANTLLQPRLVEKLKARIEALEGRLKELEP